MVTEYESEVMKFWDEKKIYEKIQKQNESGEPFNFVEGPPYPTGEAHLGHLRNWSIKDSIFRFRRFQGRNVYAKDGYDVHGLPVEQKVQKKLGINDTKELKEKFGVENFIVECRKYVAQIINDMKNVRKEIGLWFDTNHWQTSHPEYISLAWNFFKKAHEKNMLYKDFKCVAWSPALETTLSDYEVKDSYAELEDPSVYVRFKVREKYKSTNYDEYLLIWTTTPWTLEANQGIAVHKDFSYAKVLVEDDVESFVIIIAEALVNQVISKLSKTLKIKSHRVLETMMGSDLIGIHYIQPYTQNNKYQQELAKDENNHRVMHADFVTLGEGESHLEKLEKKTYKHANVTGAEETQQKAKKKLSDGTGVVHEAPAHGMEDFELCRREGITNAYCVVNEQGNMIDESIWAGMNFRDANSKIIDYLKEKRVILHAEWKKHTYPLCWRSKVPIVYRTTEQWYVKRGDYTDEIIKANQNVKWFPKSAKISFNNLMSGAGDWAISRQRFWGIPMPVFSDDEGNYEVFGSKEELEDAIGEKLEDVHLDNLAPLSYKHKETGNVMRHIGLTVDVWFDSGAASFASHYGEELDLDGILKKYYPMSFVTESEDQVRGWFSSLFGVGYMVSERAPYNQVLLYKFVMAKDGQKMSKSLGNGITGNEALENYGADITRYYLLTKRSPEDQLNFDLEEIPEVKGFFNTLENTFSYANRYLSRYEFKEDMVNFESLNVEDLWILAKFNLTLQTYIREFEEYKIDRSIKAIEEFLVQDFSKTYLKLIKERAEERDENLLQIFSYLLRRITILLGPAIPFKAESLYQEINLENKKESVFLERLPIIDELLIRFSEKKNIIENFDLAQEIITAILNAREKVKIGIRWPLSHITLLTSENLKLRLEPFEKLIKGLANVGKLEYTSDEINVDYSIKPNFASLKKDFENTGDIIRIINTHKSEIVNALKGGKLNGSYDGISIDFERHLIKETVLGDELAGSEISLGQVVLHTHQDEILLEKGYLRELIRRVQDKRKAEGLRKEDDINLSFTGSDEYFSELINNWGSYITKKVGAQKIVEEDLNNKQEFIIKDRKLVVSFNRL